MPQTKIRIDFSKVASMEDFCRQMAEKMGFECGCTVMDAFFDHLRDANAGYHRHVHLKPGETLRIGAFAFKGLYRRDAHLARKIEKFIAASNEEAIASAHGAPFYEFVTIAGPDAAFE